MSPRKRKFTADIGIERLTENVGYSGHFGVDDAIAAIGYDLRIVEKHFTLVEPFRVEIINTLFCQMN